MAGGQCTYLCPINAKISHRPLLDCKKKPAYTWDKIEHKEINWLNLYATLYDGLRKVILFTHFFFFNHIESKRNTFSLFS